MKLSIIIVNYNVKYFLEQCLYSIKAATLGIECETIIIDNNSDDGSIEYLQPKFTSVRFISNKDNVGFSKACNQGYAIAQGEYILFLNPDTILSENTLHRCINFLEQHNNAGAVGPKIVDANGHFLPESKRSLPSPSIAFYKMTGIEKIFPTSKIFGKYSLGYLNKDETHEVEILSGAYMMIRKAALDKVGCFDERFFMYGEDIDLCYRLHLDGYKIYYLGDTNMLHFRGKSTKKNSAKYIQYFYNAMILFVEKYYHGLSSVSIKFFLKSFILSRTALSALAIPAREKDYGNSHTHEIALIGDKIAAEQASKIITEQLPHVVLKYVDSQNEMPSLKEIVFCIGENFSYQNAFEWMYGSHTHAAIRWFALGSESIVGNLHKNKTGEAYTLVHQHQLNTKQKLHPAPSVIPV
ncbi:MAG: glycosyltransferase family 2 protein [Chitinophagaceae bacterium]|nr:glycosyltransferase family 2 protein [Chitinophagaceae bacterium]